MKNTAASSSSNEMGKRSLSVRQKVVAGQLLWRCRRQCGSQVRHVWERGFARSQWLHEALVCDLHFVLRWPKRYRLLDQWGELRKAWQIARQAQREHTLSL